MNAPRTVTIGDTLIYTSGDLVVCYFPDGAMTRAYPQDTPEYRQTAQDLGYGDDTARMNRTHDPAHCVLAEACGMPHSPALWATAHGEPESPDHWVEEEVVMALQRYSNGGPRPAGEMDWDGVVERLREVTE